jgi:hypothetical protein
MISASSVLSPSAARKRSAEIGSLAITKTFISSATVSRASSHHSGEHTAHLDPAAAQG